MSNPTAAQPSRRQAYDATRKREQDAFDRQAALAGHAPWPVVTDTNIGPVVQYQCWCDQYRSPVGSSASARQGWVSHARMMLTNPTRLAS